MASKHTRAELKLTLDSFTVPLVWRNSLESALNLTGKCVDSKYADQ